MIHHGSRCGYEQCNGLKIVGVSLYLVILIAIGDHLSKLSELPPSFLLAGLMGDVISLLDKAGYERIRDTSDDLAMAGRK